MNKNNVFATFKSFVKGIHNEFETTIKRVRSDNGSEFKNTRIDEFDKKGTRLNKFDKKCDEGFLLGYSTTSKTYRV